MSEPIDEMPAMRLDRSLEDQAALVWEKLDELIGAVNVLIKRQWSEPLPAGPRPEPPNEGDPVVGE